MDIAQDNPKNRVRRDTGKIRSEKKDRGMTVLKLKTRGRQGLSMQGELSRAVSAQRRRTGKRNAVSAGLLSRNSLPLHTHHHALPLKC